MRKRSLLLAANSPKVNIHACTHTHTHAYMHTYLKFGAFTTCRQPAKKWTTKVLFQIRIQTVNASRSRFMEHRIEIELTHVLGGFGVLVCMRVCMYVCGGFGVLVCMRVCMYVCMWSIETWLNSHTCWEVLVCWCVCVYVCMYVRNSIRKVMGEFDSTVTCACIYAFKYARVIHTCMFLILNKDSSSAVTPRDQYGHTYIHAYIHIYMHAYMHAYTPACF